jgi:hypothetical protein
MPKKSNALEIELDLTARHLLAPLSAGTETLEVDDLNAIESLDQHPISESAVSNTSQALDETSEIELTAEQMDAMLEGRWPE